MINYIGDIAKEDAIILRDMARESTNILEFGVGASTQVLAAYAKGKVTSVETDMNWVKRTKENLILLDISTEVEFRDYYTFEPEGEYDLIFDDGATEFRLPFAQKTWKHLKIGGYLLIHDTRTSREVQVVHDFMKEFSPEIESIFINKDHSNITVIKKKVAEFYINWNETEDRKPWQSGYEPVNLEEFKAMQEKEQSSDILASKYHDYRMAGITIYPDAPKGMGINEFAEWLRK